MVRGINSPLSFNVFPRNTRRRVFSRWILLPIRKLYLAGNRVRTLCRVLPNETFRLQGFRCDALEAFPRARERTSRFARNATYICQRVIIDPGRTCAGESTTLTSTFVVTSRTALSLSSQKFLRESDLKDRKIKKKKKKKCFDRIRERRKHEKTEDPIRNWNEKDVDRC